MREETLKHYSYNNEMIGNLTFYKLILEDFCWIETPKTAFKGTYFFNFLQKSGRVLSFHPPD